VFEIHSSPAFADDHEVWVEVPEPFAHFDEEGIWVGLHIIRIPVAMVFISNNNLAVHEVFCGVGRFTVNVNPLKFFNVWLHDLGPSLAIIKMNTVELIVLAVLNDLVNEEVP